VKRSKWVRSRKYFREWDDIKKIENMPSLSKEFTLLFFRELSPNIPQHRKIHFKTDSGVHYFEFKTKYEGVRSRWRRMRRISEQKGFIAWIPPTEKMIRKLKLKLLLK